MRDRGQLQTILERASNQFVRVYKTHMSKYPTQIRGNRMVLSLTYEATNATGEDLSNMIDFFTTELFHDVSGMTIKLCNHNNLQFILPRESYLAIINNIEKYRLRVTQLEIFVEICR